MSNAKTGPALAHAPIEQAKDCRLATAIIHLCASVYARLPGEMEAAAEELRSSAFRASAGLVRLSERPWPPVESEAEAAIPQPADGSGDAQGSASSVEITLIGDRPLGIYDRSLSDCYPTPQPALLLDRDRGRLNLPWSELWLDVALPADLSDTAVWGVIATDDCFTGPEPVIRLVHGRAADLTLTDGPRGCSPPGTTWADPDRETYTMNDVGYIEPRCHELHGITHSYFYCRADKVTKFRGGGRRSELLDLSVEITSAEQAGMLPTLLSFFVSKRYCGDVGGKPIWLQDCVVVVPGRAYGFVDVLRDDPRETLRWIFANFQIEM